MLQAISTMPTVPVVRVPWLEPGILMKALDAGAYAVICPMVNTREDAQRLVSYTHYAPRGTRSFGPVRASLYGGSVMLLKLLYMYIVSVLLGVAVAFCVLRVLRSTVELSVPAT